MAEANTTMDETNCSFLGGSYETRLHDTEGKVIEVIAEHFKISDRDIHLDTRLSGDLKVDHKQITDDGTDLENKLKRSFEIEVWDVDENEKKFKSVRDVVEFVRSAERRPLEIETPDDEDWHPDDPRWLEWEEMLKKMAAEADQETEASLKREPKLQITAYACLLGIAVFWVWPLLKQLDMAFEHASSFRDGLSLVLWTPVKYWWSLLLGLVCVGVWFFVSSERNYADTRVDRHNRRLERVRDWRREKRIRLDEEARWNANKST